MDIWPARAARAHFSKMLRTAEKKGPQLITRRGVEIGVLVSVETLDRLRQSAGPELTALPLGAEPRLENVVPKRGSSRRRPPLKF